MNRKPPYILTHLASAVIMLIGQLWLAFPLPIHAATTVTGAFIVEGDDWAYSKGTTEPAANWNALGFDDSSWLSGPTGIGYGGGDDATVLEDMQGNYASVYLRREFEVDNPSALVNLTLKVDYDDGFVAYLNSIEVARRGFGAPGTPVPYNTLATSHDAGIFESIDISDYLSEVVTGTNVLAIQVHNASLSSSDLSMIPELHWQDDGPNILRYPYLQMLGTDTVTIIWTTDAPGPSELRYSTDLSYGSVVPAISTHKTVNAPAPYDDYYEHLAVLSGLDPGTTYHYAIYTQDTELATENSLYFRTHPVSGSEVCTFNFAAFGDPSTNDTPAQDVRDQAVARGFDFALVLGDLAYDYGTYEELEINYFNLFQDILWNRMMWPVIGDHDIDTYTGLDAPYFDVFHLPEQALLNSDHERYYSFDYGNAHFVILDTNGPLWDVGWIEDSMGDWLETDLAANDRFWTIVAMHHPWYVSDTREHYDPIHDFLAPIFEAYGVDLVLTGNDHLYERTYPIKEDALSTVAEGGVIYVTNGEAGSSSTYYDFYDPAPDWSAARSNHTNENYDASYTHIYIDNGVMSLITVNDLGEVIDPAGSTDPLAIIDRSGEPGANCPATISGAVYEDNDGDGAISASDTPLADIEISLSNGMTTTTDISGVYQFELTVPGAYTITEQDPPGYLSSGDAQGDNDNTITVDLEIGEKIYNLDFSDYRPASISGAVYLDYDRDGAYSPGDAPLAGVEIELSNGMTAITGIDGFYQFTGLLPGSYVITELDPPDHFSVTNAQGDNDNLIFLVLRSGENIVEQFFVDQLFNKSYLPLVMNR